MLAVYRASPAAVRKRSFIEATSLAATEREMLRPAGRLGELPQSGEDSTLSALVWALPLEGGNHFTANRLAVGVIPLDLDSDP